MNLLRVAKAVVLNLPTTADIDLATYGTDECWIKGLIPFKRADLVSINRITAAAEVQQVMTIAAVTVVANTRYQILAGNILDRNFEYNNRLKPYTAVTPAVLVGVSATDNYNLQTRLASRINSDIGAKFFAGAKVVAAITSVTLNYATPGLNRPVWIKGATSGCIGFIYFTALGVPNSGTVNGATKTTVTFYNWNGTTAVAETFNVIASPIDGSLGTGNAIAVTSITTLGGGLAIVDKSGYYNATTTRHGISTVQVTSGFVSSDITTTVIGAVSSGQGPRLAQNVPVKEVSSDNLASGDWNFPSASNNPVSNTVDQSKVSDLTNSNAGGYDIITIIAKKPVNASAATSMQQNNQLQQIIYAVNDAAGYAAFYTKLGTI